MYESKVPVLSTGTVRYEYISYMSHVSRAHDVVCTVQRHRRGPDTGGTTTHQRLRQRGSHHKRSQHRARTRTPRSRARGKVARRTTDGRPQGPGRGQGRRRRPTHSATPRARQARSTATTAVRAQRNVCIGTVQTGPGQLDPEPNLTKHGHPPGSQA